MTRDINDIVHEAKETQAAMKRITRKLLRSHSVDERNSLLKAPEQNKPVELGYQGIYDVGARYRVGTMPPVVQVNLIWNAKGTIYVKLWKYGEDKPIERVVSNMEQVVEFINESSNI